MASKRKAEEDKPSDKPKGIKVIIPEPCDYCANYGKSFSIPESKPVWTASEFNKKVSKLADLQGDPTAID